MDSTNNYFRFTMAAVAILAVLSIWLFVSKDSIENNYRELSDVHENLRRDYDAITLKNQNLTYELEASKEENLILKGQVRNFSAKRSTDKIPTSPSLSNVDFLITNQSVVFQSDSLSLTKFTDTKSMHPTLSAYHTGIVSSNFDFNSLEVGMIVQYMLENDTKSITHRITEINTENNSICYTLQGDNNAFPDPGCISPNNIQGVLIGVIFDVDTGLQVTCKEGSIGIVINGELDCVSEVIPSGVYTTDQPLGSFSWFPLCSKQSSKPYTAVSPDGKVYCISSI